MARVSAALAVLVSVGVVLACAGPRPAPTPPPPGPDAGPPPEQADDCGELGMDLEEVQREVLCILLHRAGVPEAFTVRSAYWPWRKSTLLAAVYGGEPRGDRPGYRSNRLRVFAFDLAGAQPRLLAASHPAGIPLAKDDAVDFDDLKKYALGHDEHAVPVTVVRQRRYVGGDARLEQLVAFRFDGKVLQPVLQTVLGYSVDLSGGGAREALDVWSKIEVGDALPDGHLEWIKRTTDASVRLLWKRDHYEMDGDDPLGELPDAEIFRP